MSADDPIEMGDDERDAFLGAGGTGVLSLSTPDGDSPYSIPVSYGYDASTETFYFRLSVGPDSEKGDLADRPVTFVAYGRSDGQWRSVVARGRLEATTEESVATETLEGLSRTHIPYVDVFGQPPRTVSFEFYRLVPADLGARRESSSAT
jgi:nitroimidazol reductase NimA-like FMN-containing flavoprotein (pyridoxamine 5'-phosphate oxidase superfamily)